MPHLKKLNRSPPTCSSSNDPHDPSTSVIRSLHVFCTFPPEDNRKAKAVS